MHPHRNSLPYRVSDKQTSVGPEPLVHDKPPLDTCHLQTILGSFMWKHVWHVTARLPSRDAPGAGAFVSSVLAATSCGRSLHAHTPTFADGATFTCTRHTHAVQSRQWASGAAKTLPSLQACLAVIPPRRLQRGEGGPAVRQDVAGVAR